jgi:hypothetical protein
MSPPSLHGVFNGGWICITSDYADRFDQDLLCVIQSTKWSE